MSWIHQLITDKQIEKGKLDCKQDIAGDWYLRRVESSTPCLKYQITELGHVTQFFEPWFLLLQKGVDSTQSYFYKFTAKSLQSCLTLCNPIYGNPPGSPIPGILQARTLEWIAISFSNAWKLKVKGKSLSRVSLLATPWTAAYQALHPWDFPGKSTGVGCHCLFQRISPSLLNFPPISLSIPPL